MILVNKVIKLKTALTQYAFAVLNVCTLYHGPEVVFLNHAILSSFVSKGVAFKIPMIKKVFNPKSRACETNAFKGAVLQLPMRKTSPRKWSQLKFSVKCALKRMLLIFVGRCQIFDKKEIICLVFRSIEILNR